MISLPLYLKVNSGKTANDAMRFYKSDLDEADIDRINELSFAIQISDADSYQTLYTGDKVFLTIDEDYTIKEKNVYTDKETIQKVQELLNSNGYECGSADGIPGKKTNSAILDFERDHNLPETTDITPELLETLEAALD